MYDPTPESKFEEQMGIALEGAVKAMCALGILLFSWVLIPAWVIGKMIQRFNK